MIDEAGRDGDSEVNDEEWSIRVHGRPPLGPDHPQSCKFISDRCRGWISAVVDR